MNENAPPKRSFNLLTEPWIPIAGVGLVSLNDVFTHPEYTRLGGTPIEKVVLLRLLLCVVHASSPIPDVDAWIALTPQQLASNALAYLQKWSDRFDLYDETHPFLQFPQLKGGKLVTWWHLKVSSTDNNSIFTQSEFTDEFSEAEKARLLLCGVCYSCRRKGYPKIFSSYPLMGEKGFLHTFLLGKNIIETIYLNLLTLENIRKIGIFKEDILGKPFWELDYTSPQWGEKYKNSYQGCLFPLNKCLHIESDGVRRDELIVYPEFSQGYWDPGITIFSTINNKKEDRGSLLCTIEKQPWRDLGSIFEYAMGRNKHISSAFLKYGLEHIRETDLITSFGVWCGGAAVNTCQASTQKISGKNGLIESDFQIDISQVGKCWWDAYQKHIFTLEFYAKCTKESVEAYYKDKVPSDKKKSSTHISEDMGRQAERLFWEKMESYSQSILNLSCEEDKEKINSAKKEWRKVALSCYEALCPSLTSRQIQSYVENLPRFKKTSKGKENKNG